MKRAAALILVLLLAGCATSLKNPVTSTQLYNLEATYGAVLSAATGYSNLPRCTRTHLESLTNPCARLSIVVRLNQANNRAQVAFGRARTFTNNNPTLDASSLLEAVRAAVDAFRAIQQEAVVL